MTTSRIPSPAVSRRAFITVGSLGVAGLLSRCSPLPPTSISTPGNSRLTARPGAPTGQPVLGLRRLGLGTTRDGWVYVPASYNPATPAPLVLLLHGAGGAAENLMQRRIPEADQTGQILLGVDSRGGTWDAIMSGFGADIPFIDSALADTFSRYAIDASRIAVAGFSDGASYALSIGLANGDLFKKVTAWSPGFIIYAARFGKPTFFVTHGTVDPVLPIDATSRKLVPELRNDGYTVTYREFAGVHEVPSDLLHETMTWMAGTSARTKARSG